MLDMIRTLLFVLVLVTLVLSVYFSFRYRRHTDPKQRGVYAARMNICMGLMLVFISITQLFFFSDTNMRRIFGTVCLLLGFFNLFSGIRNLNYFNRYKA
ncbi:YtpI family protein [Paenibacillus sp. N1-5-1-14]|uniref:YtpI family protein n=1 Tax=Paenibacillus radicibacter TaxID=2972488 RepID=UPI0021593C3D|nr:YtpI family protein [Paenibacillus radicibacter]MCR8643706.1 YtpI family protein [Paenibacillus radicibacter]